MLKSTLRWVAIAGIFAIPVILPFIVSSSMFFPFITGKNFTFRILVEIVLGAWAVLAFMDARYRPKFSWVLATVTLFVLIIGLADFTGSNVFKSFWSNFERMEGYIAVLHLFAYFIVAGTVLSTEKLWKVFWYASLGASVLVAIVGLGPIFDDPTHFYQVRIEARFGNPIYLAVYSLFHAFIALILAEKWRGIVWHRVLLIAVAVLHMVIVVLTQTRGTTFGLLGGLMVATLLIAIFERERKALRVGAIAVLLAVATLVGTGYAIKDTNYAKTTPILGRFTQIELTTGTVHARFMNWGMAWQGAKERPILGWGQGNYEYVFSKYFDPGMYGEEPWFDRTHNIFFDWLVAAGFLGLLSYLLMPASLLVSLWTVDRENLEGRKWSLKKLLSFETIKNIFVKRDHAFTPTERALWTGLVAAYMFHNLFVFDNIISYILFFSVLAYIHFRVTEDDKSLWNDVTISEETITTAVMPVTLVVVGLLIWYINVPGIKTSQALIDALQPQKTLPTGQVVQQTPEDVLAHYKRALDYDQLGRQEVREQAAQMAANFQRNENVSQDTKVAFKNLAMAEMQKEVDRNPNSARLELFMAALYGGYGQLDKAEETFKRVLELAPRKQIVMFQLGEVLTLEGKNDEAVEVLKEAYEAETEFSEAASRYAAALIRAGRDKEAVDFITERFGDVTYDDGRVFGAWMQAKRYDIIAAILENRIAANPDDLQQYVSLAVAYNELGESEKAIAILEGVKDDHPEYTDQMDTFIKEIRGW